MMTTIIALSGCRSCLPALEQSFGDRSASVAGGLLRRCWIDRECLADVLHQVRSSISTAIDPAGGLTMDRIVARVDLSRYAYWAAGLSRRL
jgi:hypothetical protein